MRVEEVERALGVLRRTVYRDLEHLQLAGYPLENVGDAGDRRWRLAAGFRSRHSAPIDALEVAALRGAVEALAPLEGSAVHRAATAAMDRFGGASTKVAPLLALPRAGSRGPGTTHVDRLAQAIVGREQLCVVYRSFERPEASRLLDPLRLFLVQGLAYLAAWDVALDEARCFRLDRIVELAPNGHTFSPRSLDLDAWLGDAVGVWRGPSGEVRVRTSLSAAELAARLGVPEARVTASGAERCFRAAITPELATRVVALGAAVEVLVPAELRRLVASEHEGAAKLYSGRAER